MTKLNATGSALVYSTYLGGNDNDGAQAVAVDGSGNAVIVGSTESFNFPVTPGAFQATTPGNAFVTKLNATGSALVYATYLGGGDTSAHGIAVDSSGDAFVTGWTGNTDFPSTPGAFQTTFPAGWPDCLRDQAKRRRHRARIFHLPGRGRCRLWHRG